jgi:hypothetical protein
MQFAEVQYFTRLPIIEDDDENAWRFIDIALVQLYSPPDATLLQLSSHTLPPARISMRL